MPAGAVWIRTPQNNLVLQCQSGMREVGIDRTPHDKAMHDELERSRAGLQSSEGEKPYFIQYRLLDLDSRSISASFGALLSSTDTHNRFMDVNVRLGNYQLDSSDFISGNGFQGFLGSAGQVGVDGDYNSLRQDLWLATDQAYKEAVTSMGQKPANLRRPGSASRGLPFGSKVQ